MNIDLGRKIKDLRLSHSMTQEKLAQRLGVSAQAVSKWESGTNMPDIQMLPDLSIIFGISIDELFTMTDESRMERIGNSIYEIRFLSEEEFQQNIRYLENCLKKDNLNAQATLLLAMLYNKRADEYHEIARPLAKEALIKNPKMKAAHNTIFDSHNGPYHDWNYINHGRLIAFYQKMVKKHPDNVHNYFWLLDLLIHDGRTEEARKYVEEMKLLQDSYHYEMYMGYICKAECNLPAALDWWKMMTQHSPENWIVWAQYADIMAKFGRYDDAITYYKKAIPMRPKPRFYDCEEALSQIYEIRGDIDAAISMQKQMLQIVKEDWNLEGESIDNILREITRLEGLK